MKRKIILIFFLSIAIVNCKEKKENTNENKKNNSLQMNINDIKNQIELQKKANFEDFRPEKPYKPSEIDVDKLIPLIQEGLKKAGYKFISNQEFDTKIDYLLKKNKVKDYKDFITIFSNPLDCSNQTLYEHEFDFDLTNNQFIAKNNNFIFPMLFLEDVIKIENNNSSSINLPQNIIARNKYLFNDSKSDLTWLLVNDKEFLKQLVVFLGYDVEPKINKMVLDEYYEELNGLVPIQVDRIGDFFFIKDCDNIFHIREGLLKYVENSTNVDDNRYIYALSSYIDDLYNGDINKVFEKDPSKKFNSIEKAHIVAVISSVEIPAIDKYKSKNPEIWNNAGTSLYNIGISHPEVFDIIKKENYFGINNFKQIIDSTENEIKANNSKSN